MAVAGLFLGLLVGLTLGLLGGGGSVLTVPIFVYAFDLPIKTAIAMSLVVVAVTSAFGAVGHWRAGNINVRMALAFAAFAMPSSTLGAAVSGMVSGEVQLIIFATMMLLASARMFRERKSIDPPAARLSIARSAAKIGAPAAAVGFLTGLVGVGGGFLIVPVLVLLGSIPMKQAIGTSLIVIALTAATAFAAQTFNGVEVPLGTTAAFTLLAIIGAIAGTMLVPRIAQRHLRKGFALFLVATALLILFENREVLLGQ